MACVLVAAGCAARARRGFRPRRREMAERHADRTDRSQHPRLRSSQHGASPIRSGRPLRRSARTGAASPGRSRTGRRSRTRRRSSRSGRTGPKAARRAASIAAISVPAPDVQPGELRLRSACRVRAEDRLAAGRRRKGAPQKAARPRRYTKDPWTWFDRRVSTASRDPAPPWCSPRPLSSPPPAPPDERWRAEKRWRLASSRRHGFRSSYTVGVGDNTGVEKPPSAATSSPAGRPAPRRERPGTPAAARLRAQLRKDDDEAPAGPRRRRSRRCGRRARGRRQTPR